jgi:hypothetical protein
VTETAGIRARRDDLGALDHYPTCPRCGDLCGRLARICVECGAELFASPVDLADAQAVGSHAMNAAPKRDDTPATRERGE